MPKAFFPISRLCQTLTPPPSRILLLLIKNLVPALRWVLATGTQFVSTHVLPRFLAAIAAFFDPSSSRSQQRETIIVIIIPPVAQPSGTSSLDT